MYNTVLSINSLFVSTNPNSEYIGKFESGALFIALSFILVQAGSQRKKKQGPKQPTSRRWELLAPLIMFRLNDERIPSLWSKTAKNTYWSTGPLARLFARLCAPLTRSLAPDCLLLIAHFAHSLARWTVNY